MKIHLTENSFKNLISTCVYKVLNETFLMEYLVHRHNFTKNFQRKPTCFNRGGGGCERQKPWRSEC